MVKMHVDYLGELRCRIQHAPSGTTLETDAPVDNQGKGESFSPTDLVAAALASCIATTIAIYAKRHDINVEGMQVDIEKKMVTDPQRRIGQLAVVVTMASSISSEQQKIIEKVAHTCPVHKSLHPEVDAPIVFRWFSQ